MCSRSTPAAEQAQRRREILFQCCYSAVLLQVPAPNTQVFVNKLMFSYTYFGGLLLFPGHFIVGGQYNCVVVLLYVVCFNVVVNVLFKFSFFIIIHN